MPLAFMIPKEVSDEIEIGARAGYAVAVPTWATILPLKDAIAPLGPHLLDRGEAAVIQLAIEEGVSDVCIDEWRGRRAAAAIGLKVTGSLGLLGRAKTLGLTSAVSPWVQKLKASGIHYHPELLRNFLLSMGE